MIRIEPRFGTSMKLFRTHGRHVYEEKPAGDRRRHTRAHVLLFVELHGLFMKLFDKLLDRHTEWVTSR